MQFKVLGCHGGETRKHRTSSFLIDDTLAIDAGAITSTLSLEEQRKIQTVLVSHPHMDHIRDLGTLADNRCQQKGPTLNIVGISQTIDALKQHFFNDRLWPDFTKIDAASEPVIAFKEINPEKAHSIDGYKVTPIPMSHTVETSGFVIEVEQKAIAYSGDTGPTDEFWRVLNANDKLCALVMELSFPSTQQDFATRSGHHTPKTLVSDLEKFDRAKEIPIFLFHIKPVFEAEVLHELEQYSDHNFVILQLEDQFLL